MADYTPQQCQSCGNTYQRIGSHWAQSECPYPSISDSIRKIITGILMGDGCLCNRDNVPYLVCQCVEKEYLHYLDKLFGKLSSGPPRLHITGQELLENNREFLQPDGDPNYSDQYRWQTRGNPELVSYSDWYNGSGKTWPADIQLSPVTLKHWYAGDGNYNNNGTNDYISIGITNERSNKSKVNNMFERQNLPKPNRWNENEKKVEIVWNKQESRELLSYMGEAPTGYEYKWGDSNE